MSELRIDGSGYYFDVKFPKLLDAVREGQDLRWADKRTETNKKSDFRLLSKFKRNRACTANEVLLYLQIEGIEEKD